MPTKQQQGVVPFEKESPAWNKEGFLAKVLISSQSDAYLCETSFIIIVLGEMSHEIVYLHTTLFLPRRNVQRDARSETGELNEQVWFFLLLSQNSSAWRI